MREIDFLALVTSLDGTRWKRITTNQESHVLRLQLLYFVLQINGNYLRKDLIGEKAGSEMLDEQ